MTCQLSFRGRAPSLCFCTYGICMQPFVFAFTRPNAATRSALTDKQDPHVSSLAN